MRRRWPWFVLAALVALLVAYVAAGPYLAVRGIRSALAEQDAAALSRHVDFPALRASLKAQLGDRLVRSVGIDAGSGLLGALGMRLAGGLTDGAVEMLVTPVGLAALMEGRKVWTLVGEGVIGTPPAQGIAQADPSRGETGGLTQPLQGARYRYESLSRFTATVPYDGDGEVVFVITRKGMRWRLSDIRLPPLGDVRR